MKNLILFLSLFFITEALGKKHKPVLSSDHLLHQFSKNLSKKEMNALKKRTLAKAGKAVPTLIKVMKNSKYPDKNRWMATFLLGQITGKKGVPFIGKFLQHPNWVMRMASLKALLALRVNEKQYAQQYARALKDKSFIVRRQALENIDRLKLKNMAPYVWEMLYDKKNYYQNKKSKKSKRTNLVKEAIRVVGRLKFEKAATPLLSMTQKKKYEDIFPELEYSLQLILGKKAPDGAMIVKRRFWKKLSISNMTI